MWAPNESMCLTLLMHCLLKLALAHSSATEVFYLLVIRNWCWKELVWFFSWKWKQGLWTKDLVIKMAAGMAPKRSWSKTSTWSSHCWNLKLLATSFRMYSRTSLDTTESENRAFGTASLICLKKRVITVEFLASDFSQTRPKPKYLSFLNSG